MMFMSRWRHRSGEVYRNDRITVKMLFSHYFCASNFSYRIYVASGKREYFSADSMDRLGVHVIFIFTFSSLESRHLLYLQLRKSILESQVLCTDDDLISLGGLALQAEIGDFKQSVCVTLF